MLDGTYTGLQASIAGWLHRTDLAAVIPDLVALAEARIARDLRLRRQVSSAVLTTVPGTQGISLPADYRRVAAIPKLGSGKTDFGAARALALSLG